MSPEPSLPQRNRGGGYNVTDIVLEVTAASKLVRRIVGAVAMPSPPRGKLTEMQLAELVRNLTPLAARALDILQKEESANVRTNYADAQYKRVQIKVLSGGRLIGRINGAQQTFDPRGKTTSMGALTHVDTSPRNRPKRDGGAGNDKRS